MRWQHGCYMNSVACSFLGELKLLLWFGCCLTVVWQ